MSEYIESILRDNEQLVYRAKLHWIVALWPLLFVVLSVPVTALSRTAGLALLGQLWMGFASIWVAASVIDYLISEMAVTDQRIVGKVGFFKGKLIDTELSRIEEIVVTQGAVGRALGYGSLVVRARREPELRIHRLLDPERFRQMAVEQTSVNTPDGPSNDPRSQTGPAPLMRTLSEREEENRITERDRQCE
ncbi:MAG: PH domain-containing protein [Deltaproteobacteria bacterium]